MSWALCMICFGYQYRGYCNGLGLVLIYFDGVESWWYGFASAGAGTGIHNIFLALINVQLKNLAALAGSFLSRTLSRILT